MTVHNILRGSPGGLRWPTLFSPFQIGRRTVANWIVSTPHPTNWRHGLLTQSKVDYHVRKAAGGVGLVMTQWICLAPSARPGAKASCLGNE